MFRKYQNDDGLKILLPDSIFTAVQKEVVKFYPNECGGVFVGSVKEERTAVIEKMFMPKTNIGTPVLFRRVPDFINKLLQRVFKQNNGETIYLGEWHSHPDGLPLPSRTDFKAMLRIAENSDTRIRTPIMLIISYAGHQFEERFYILINNKLIPYEHV